MYNTLGNSAFAPRGLMSKARTSPTSAGTVTHASSTAGLGSVPSACASSIALRVSPTGNSSRAGPCERYSATAAAAFSRLYRRVSPIAPHRGLAECGLASRKPIVESRLGHTTCQLRPRRHSQLPENLVQVILNRARADEQLRGDLSVGVTFRRQTRNLFLLRGQLSERVDGAFPSVLAGGLQLDPRPLGERIHSEVVEHFVRRSKLVARVDSTRPTPEPLSVEQSGARKVESQTARREPVDGLTVERFCFVVIG